MLKNYLASKTKGNNGTGNKMISEINSNVSGNSDKNSEASSIMTSVAGQSTYVGMN